MASVAETLISACFATMKAGPYPALSSDIGEKFFHVHGDTTRVVAAPLGTPGEFRQPDRHGDGNFADVGRILLLRDFAIKWQCWDLTFEATENLFLEVVRTMRGQNHHSIVFSNEVWEDQQTNQDGWIKYGTVISFECAIALPIYEKGPTRVALTATPQISSTVSLPDDGSGEVVIINQGTP